MAHILDRDIARAQTEEVRALGDPVLRKVIDYGAAAFERCSQTAPDGDENLGLLMPFHHTLEMLDAVQVLLEQSCVVACRPPLRSAFEGAWSIEYVLEQDTKRRGLAYVVGDLKERIRWYEQHDPETSRGKHFAEEMGFDDESEFPRPDVDEVRKARAKLENVLRSETFSEIDDEYRDTAKQLNRSMPPWYSLFGGPRNIRELAKHVGDIDDYIIVYKAWSLTTHAVDLNRQVGAAADGSGASVSVIRSPLGMPNVYSFACSIGSSVIRDVLGHYRPGEAEGFATWFLEEVNPTSEALTKIREDISL